MTGDGIPDLLSRSAGLTDRGQLKHRVGLGHRFGSEELLTSAVDPRPVDGFEAKERAGTDDLDSTSRALSHDTTLTTFQSLTLGGSLFGGLWSATVTLRQSNTRVTRQLVDLNGDGMADLLSKEDGKPIHVQWNLGGQFTTPRVWTTPAWSTSPSEVGLLDGGFVPVVTQWLANLAITGPDVLAATGSQFGVSISAQGSLPIIPGLLSVSLGVSGSRDVDTYEMSLFDVDGDGDADHVLRRKHGSGPAKIYVKRNQLTGKANLLKTIQRPLGATITLDYSRVGNTVAMPQSRHVLTTVEVDDGSDLGMAEFASPKVVTQIAYGAGFYHRGEKEFFGFDKVTTTRADDVAVEETFDNTSYLMHGRLVSSLRRGGGVALSERLVTYTEKLVTDAEGNLVGPTERCTAVLHPLLDADACTPRLVVVTEEREVRRETTGTGEKVHVVKDTEHDRFGNVVESVDHGDDAIATDDLHVRATYRDDVPRWILGRPTALVVRAGNASGHVLRSRSGEYNALGDLAEIGVATGTGIAKTTLSYDVFGNVTRVETPENHRMQRQTFEVEYDAVVATYPVATTNGFGEISRATYDLRFGVATEETGTSGAKLTRTVDAFGRVTSVSGPYDTTAPGIEMAYFPNEAKPRAVTTTRTSPPPGYTGPVAPPINVVTIVDGLGRTVELRKSAVVGGVEGMTSSGLVQRDNIGHVIAAYQPFFTPGAAVENPGFVPPQVTLAMRTAYDVNDRPVAVTYPGGAIDATSYSLEPAPVPGAPLLFVTKSLAANGNRRESYADLLGRVRAFVEHPTEPEATSPATAVSRYDYLATGELSQIVDAENNITTLGYDLRGLRTSLDNPDTGLVVDRFDPMGNRIALIEPNHRRNGAEVLFEYDFDRLVGINYQSKPDVTMRYGTTGNSTGRLVLVEDDESGSQSHDYGAQGELVRTVRTVPADKPGPPLVFDTRFAVDSLGRQLEIRYPDGATIRSSYDAGGMLSRIDNVDFAQPYASEIEYDVYGNRTKLRIGNGVVTTWKFDPQRVRLESVDTTLPGPSARAIQALRYSYDPSGNPEQIQNLLPTLSGNSGTLPGDSTVDFIYDGADRLFEARGSAQLSAQKRTMYVQKHRYSASHNLTAKSRSHWITQPSQVPTYPDATNFASDYAYEGGHPHLPSRIGDLTVTYDPSGNPVTRQTAKSGSLQTLVWDDDGRLVDYQGGGVHQHNTYDASGLRVRRKSTQSETVFASMYFDVENGTQGVRHVFAGDLRVASELGKFASGENPPKPDKRGTAYYFHGDQIGSTTVLTADDGSVHQSLEFFADGETWVDRGPQKPVNRYLFSGKAFDPDTGFYDFGQRFYEPRTGMWLGVDPAFTGAASRAVGQPTFVSPLAFAMHNPLRFTDPDGRDPDSINADMHAAEMADTPEAREAFRGNSINWIAGIGRWARRLMFGVEVQSKCAAAQNCASDNTVYVDDHGNKFNPSKDSGRLAYDLFMLYTGGASGKPSGRALRSGPVLTGGGRATEGAAAAETATLRPYGGPGGGHHVPAKSAFTGAAGYDANAALAIPNAEMARLGVSHSAVTGAQATQYRAFAMTGNPITWEAVATIETNALIRGGMAPELARATVAKAVDALKNAGVAGPTRIPWGK